MNSTAERTTNNLLERKWSLRLIQVSAIFGLIGTYIGSQMAGTMDYALRPIHAHILLVGWLSIFAWGVFYRLYTVKYKKLVTAHGILALIGSIGLNTGMWFYYLNPFNMNDTFVLIYFIAGGTILLFAFALFAIITFLTEKD